MATFFVSALLDSPQHRVNTRHCGVVELVRIFGKQGWTTEPEDLELCGRINK